MLSLDRHLSGNVWKLNQLNMQVGNKIDIHNKFHLNVIY